MTHRHTLLSLTICLCFAALGCSDSNKNKATAKGPDTTKTKKDAKTDDKKSAPKSPKAATNEMPFEATGPVATIDGKEVSADVFNEEVKNLVKRTRGRMPAGMLANYKSQILDSVVNDQIFQKKITEFKIKISDDQLTAEIAKTEKRMGGKEKFAQMLKARGMEAGEMKDGLRKRMAYDAVLDKMYSVKIADPDVQKFYKDNPDQFKHQAQVKASHILFKLKPKAEEKDIKAAEAKAKKIAKDARKKGADFGALAKKHSEGPSAPKGGDLGFFTAGRMVKPFSEAAFAMKVGDISDPVRSRFGFHVIKVVEKKVEKAMPFDEVKDKIRQNLEIKKLRESMNKFRTESKEKYKIVLNEKNIKVNVKAPPKGMNPFGGHGGHGHGGHGGHGAGDGHGHAHPHGGKGGHAHPPKGKKIQLKAPSVNPTKVAPKKVAPPTKK